MKKTALVLFTACLIAMVLLTLGCPNPPSTPTNEDGGKTYTLYSEPAMDGSVTWWGASDYRFSAADLSVNIGAWNSGDPLFNEFTRRCFISFNLSSLPAGAQIESAVLRVYQNSFSSGDSYGKNGDVTVGIASYSTFATVLDGGNWNAAYYGTLATAYTANTWHTLDVMTELNYELTNTKSGRFQLMMRHEMENSSDAPPEDTDGWVMGDSPTNRPELVIITK
jgi:hypothetical protein